MAGKQIKIIATGGEKLQRRCQGVPTVKDEGYPDYVVTSWNALSGRAGHTAGDHREAKRGDQRRAGISEIRSQMAELGMEPLTEHARAAGHGWL